ncbi:transcription initiation factor TFIID subunit 6 isoform X1 [Histomonas meleagridis]|uniref:transcription initiation factor TFIID subunit 6 isoform X1 n=1 Tax=Histomonas meleagridis TaxID=135588 RepID=UPI003559E7F9|nr:transcription initiation factor TFIID subunit 6 isoform X1 [Histomonas meleagridis]KAH0806003.1 transcription initiation factor TFIID subunit 6 isoform X1 [Histomonas meleagridis]
MFVQYNTMALNETVIEISQELDIKFSSERNSEDIARDAESFIIKIVELANRIRKHKHMTWLKASDINESLKSKMLQPLYGYQSNEIEQLVHIGQVSDLDILAYDDEQIPLTSFAHSPLKGYPQDRLFDFHWLAINGIQPQIEQNVCEHDIKPTIPNRLLPLTEQMRATDQSVLLISSKTILPQSLQNYYCSSLETIKQRFNSQTETTEFLKLLDSLSNETAIQPLLPFFLKVVSETIVTNGKSPQHLQVSLNLARALFSNARLDTELFLHSFISIAITLLVHSPLGDDHLDDMYNLRSSAADFLNVIVLKSQHQFPKLQQNIAEYLISIVFDSRLSLPSQLGAVLGLQCVDKVYIRNLLIPNLPSMFTTIRNEMNSKDMTLRIQSSHLYGALLRLCALCFHPDYFDGELEEEYKCVFDAIVGFFGDDFLSFCEFPKN